MKTNVTFDSAGLKIAGHLYTPDDGATGPWPAIVVGDPGSSVKEPAASLYAQRLAGQGFVTLAFDAAYQGESGGEPRGLEDPAHRVENLKAAVSFLATRARWTPARSAHWASVPPAAMPSRQTATDHHIKAVATVSAVDIARQFRYGADGAQDRPSSRACSTRPPEPAPPRPAARASRPSSSSPIPPRRPSPVAGTPSKDSSTTAPPGSAPPLRQVPHLEQRRPHGVLRRLPLPRPHQAAAAHERP